MEGWSEWAMDLSFSLSYVLSVYRIGCPPLLCMRCVRTCTRAGARPMPMAQNGTEWRVVPGYGALFLGWIVQVVFCNVQIAKGVLHAGDW